MLRRNPPPPKREEAGVAGVPYCLEPWEGAMGVGAERVMLKVRIPKLPKDLPPPTRAQASISRIDRVKKKAKIRRPHLAQRYANIVLSSNGPCRFWG
jgi:hypothetical protein